MRFIGTGIVVGLSTFALAMLGCQSPGNVEKHFGEAQREIHQAQIANPEAGQHPDTGEIDLDGEVVENIMGRYRKAQKQTPKKTAPAGMVGTANIGQ